MPKELNLEENRQKMSVAREGVFGYGVIGVEVNI